MSENPKRLAALAAVMAEGLRTLDRLSSILDGLEPRLAAEDPDYASAAGIGYALHNTYTALEEVFEQISRTFENHVTDPAHWHRELLGKMFLEIPGVRPAVLPATLRVVLNDLRGFRHLFRHAYDFELDPARLHPLVADWKAARGSVFEALGEFSRRIQPPTAEL